MNINYELFKIIVCPECKGGVEITKDGLICLKCNILYKIIDNVPVMISDNKSSAAVPVSNNQKRNG